MADRRATGTELAAMRLALGVLRRGVAEHGPAYRWILGAASSHIGSACRVLHFGRLDRFDGDNDVSLLSIPVRLVRARLALYLRARLRMERGDLGRSEWCCPGCDWHHAYPVKPADFCDCDVPMARRRARITPLWQLAPAHKVHR